MQLKINDKYIIRTDQYNVMLSEIKISEKGEKAGQEYYNDIGFYSTFRSALWALARKDIMKADLYGLQEICQRLDELKADITEATRSLDRASYGFKDKQTDGRESISIS